MGMLAAFILTYLGAAFFGILGGVPFSALVVLFINFLIQVPIAIALGFDKPSPGLMERKPRPLSQPVLSSSQWVRLVFMGLLVAIGTLAVEREFQTDAALSATMGMVVFSLFNIAFGLSARSETGTVFVRDTVGDRRQLQLYGLALLLTVLATELGFLQKILGTVSILGDYRWLLCIALAFALLLVDEVVKFFMRRSRARREARTQ
jgi:Ca2+-transporting ATPase